ncbi:response regulator transcription factor [Shimia abyssi]|uniref:LuxR family two component transcriptional regulator n=1 Tax=Shimia abyssi TaxID=1662395 RepID=A0A2P8F7L0_9RHOB|nr:response regulator transcription factor [Shimia abyssi]PSL17700.1 LuxR family two component transcriptional regulator [Shimia abyssi]
MKILVADDHGLLRDTLVAFVASAGDAETHTAPDLNGALDVVVDHGPFDLVLLDYNMPGMNGLDGLEKMQALEGAHHVALLSGEASRSVAEAALEAGAAGFVPKTLSAKSLVNAIRFMVSGEQYVPVDFLASGTERKDSHPLARTLTMREMQVLEGLTEGKSNKEIARDLNLSEPTIKLHVKTLYRKVGAANRTQAALIAREQGLF